MRHVPDVKKNLISLGVLGTAGWIFSGDGITVNMIKGVTVAIKGLRHTSNLYKMIGSKVTGDASIGTVKKLKSILKKSVPMEKFKESLNFIQVLKN